MNSTRDMAVNLVRRYLHSSECSWSNGISGAIGEFMYDAGERVSFGENARRLHAVTDRGAIALNLPEEIACVAYEDIAHCTRSWTQVIAFALPRKLSLLSVNHVITALGADSEAIRSGDRDKQLFDLGLGSELVRFCVRSGDTGLVKELNSFCGQSLSGQGYALLELLQNAAPVRVVLSKVGRIEVSTPIPRKGGHTEAGPHTHLLPQLLGKDKTVLPCAYPAVMHVYPPHPLHDKYGVDKSFDRAQFGAFQEVLEQVGLEDYLDAKHTAGDPSAEIAGVDAGWYDIARRVVKMQTHQLGIKN